MADDIEVTRHVDAPPAAVWSLVGDPSRIGEISPECYRTRWLGGATGPAPGARFLGFNRKGLLWWPTTSTIAAYEPEQEISWDVAVAGQAVARWSFRLVPDGDGTAVTQTWRDDRTALAGLIGKARTTDSPGHNRRGMEQTLARVAEVSERP